SMYKQPSPPPVTPVDGPASTDPPASSDHPTSPDHPASTDRLEYTDGPALVGAEKTIYFFVNVGGGIYFNRAVLGQSFEGWSALPNNAQATSGVSVGAVNNYLYLVMRGASAQVYLNQGSGTTFNPWTSMNFETDSTPAVTGAGNNVYFFARTAGGRV